MTTSDLVAEEASYRAVEMFSEGRKTFSWMVNVLQLYARESSDGMKKGLHKASSLVDSKTFADIERLLGP